MLPAAAETGFEISERAWLIASACVLVAAAALRLVALNMKPMHHDEGVNGFFLMNLLKQGTYHYDPSNYHGPTLYFLTLPLAYIADGLRVLDSWVLRLVTVAFGVGTVWLVLALRRYVGAVGALAGAALVAASPACVFYSRYFIHEALFVFFTLGMVVAALRFYEAKPHAGANMFAGLVVAAGALLLLGLSVLAAWTPQLLSSEGVPSVTPGLRLVAFIFVGWIAVLIAATTYGGGHTKYLMLASASAAMLFATKETAFISVGTLLLAWLVTYVWVYATGGARSRGRAQSGLAELVTEGGKPLTFAALALVVALALFAFLWVLFYSSFFTYWKGAFWDSFKAFDIWSKTGMSAFHEKPAHTYVKWLIEEEWPILLLACVGACVALFERRMNRFAIFASAWAFGLLAAYSIIKYKTPWLVLSFVVPMCVAAGYAAQALGRVGWNRLLPLLAAFALGSGVLLRKQETLADVYSSLADPAYHSSKGSFDVMILLLGCVILLTAFTLAVKWASGGGASDWRASLVVAAAALAFCSYQTAALNFFHYDDDSYPYVYSHTRREMVEMVREVERVGERAGTKEPGVSVVSPEYWPLPWYFRDNPRVGYTSNVSSYYEPQTTLVVIGRKSETASEDQSAKLRAVLGTAYVEVGTYALRPGVDLILFERRDLAQR